MCPRCLEKLSSQWPGQSLNLYLERFDCPVVVLDESRRVLRANPAVQRHSGRSEKDLQGLLGGDAMLCRWADLPDGCGGTVHCKGCTIRRLVESCRDTGELHEDVPASIMHPDGEVAYQVTTRRLGRAVLVIVKPAD